MGGDEIFAGYPRHLAAQLDPARGRPAARRSGGRSARSLEGRLTLGRPGRLRGPRRNLMKLAAGPRPPTRWSAISPTRSYYRPEELARAAERRPARGARRPRSVPPPPRLLRARRAGEHWLNQLLYVDMKTFLPCLNLAYTDKMSMAASTEVRVPLLDDELVELAGRDPARAEAAPAHPQVRLQESMEGVLPQDVIWRPKAGFGAPLRSWLVGDLEADGRRHAVARPRSRRAGSSTPRRCSGWSATTRPAPRTTPCGSGRC